MFGITYLEEYYCQWRLGRKEMINRIIDWEC